jgi:hypothetical protein
VEGHLVGHAVARRHLLAPGLARLGHGHHLHRSIINPTFKDEEAKLKVANSIDEGKVKMKMNSSSSGG